MARLVRQLAVKRHFLQSRFITVTAPQVSNSLPTRSNQSALRQLGVIANRTTTIFRMTGMDRRRVNGPKGLTVPPIFIDSLPELTQRSRNPNDLRRIFLQTGVTPSASGSAYLEVESALVSGALSSRAGGMKVTCTVHGPRSLPRSAPFSPHLVLSAHVKYAPFATRQRRGYLRDAGEKDLSVHLETALRGVVIAERWPKSGMDVVVTIIEGDQTMHSSQDLSHGEWDTMNVLASCVTVASAAIVDSGIDCVDTVAGGVAALVYSPNLEEPNIVLDPVLSEHDQILAACCVAYLPARDEIVNLWIKGRISSINGTAPVKLIRKAVEAARATSKAVGDCLLDAMQRSSNDQNATSATVEAEAEANEYEAS